ncbi:MAG: efflux RND transporter periplasmic adaptor subunit [Gemmatimonadales bacterium]
MLARRLICGVLLLAACKGKAAGPAAGGGGMPPTAVEVAVARADTVVDALDATGQIEAVQAIELKPDIEGRVVQLPVAEGTEVEAGAALVRIDDQELKAQVARAEAERDLAGQALARAKELLTARAGSSADLERAEATARSTQADLELYALRLARTTVRAPFAGVVGQRFVSLGDYVTTGSRLMTVQTVNPQRVSFTVPERFASRLTRGQIVRFRVASIVGQEFVGTVDFVDPVVQLPGRTILMKAIVPNGRRQLHAGMFAEAKLATDTRPRAVVIPEDALVPLQGSTVVWVVLEGKAVRRPVTTGVRSPGFVEVKTGVEAGEQVVVGGQERLFDGAPVAPTVVERSATRVAE